MKSIKPLLAAALLVGGLGIFFSGSLRAEPVRVAVNLRGETVLLPPSAPERERLLLTSFFTINAETEIIAAMAVYDDPQTGTQVDYVELYDSKGGLLSVGWVDRFGIQRTAMDYGLLEEEASGLKGVLVLLIEGTPV